VDTEVSLRDAEGNEVPADTPGELFSRGPALFSGYWRNPNATAESVQDGWVSVGNIATRDDEGYLYIVDRKKDMIISGGINVYPREIENVLAEHPAILECAVFGLKDDQWGESIHGAMVCRSETSAEVLVEWLEKRVARFKIPNFFNRIEELPRNGSGKILKRILVEQFSGHLD
jgi:long-chain acyl-CoA synthetase